MKYIHGDLLEGDWDVAMHCANPHQVMGSGVAYFLKKKWPEVYQADLEYDIDPVDKLGTYSLAKVEPGRFVYNLYGQVGIGNNGTVLGRNCQYDHLYNAMYRACADAIMLSNDIIKIGVPQLGCGLAGGSWVVVESMLKDLETRFPVIFTVYVLQSPIP